MRVVPHITTSLPQPPSSASPHYSGSSSGGEEQQSNSGADSENEGLVIEEGQPEEHQPVRSVILDYNLYSLMFLAYKN